MMPHQISRATIVASISIVALIILAGHFMATELIGPSSGTSTATASIYLLSAVGACKGPSGFAPCFGGNITQAEVFNCANVATLPSGCTQVVMNPSNQTMSYRITIWYPVLAQSNEPSWANCKYQSSGDPTHQYFGNCILTNSTAFVVAQPSPPPV